MHFKQLHVRYRISMILFITLTTLSMPAKTFAQASVPTHEPPRHTDLQTQIDSLGARVSNLESTINHSLPHSWSCLARCGGFFGSQLRERPVTGTGTGAAAAFNGMISQCSDHLFIDVNTDNIGNRTLVRASFQNSCIRD